MSSTHTMDFHQWSQDQLRYWSTYTYPTTIQADDIPSLHRYYITTIDQYPTFLITSWDWVDISIATGHRLFTPSDDLYEQWHQGNLSYQDYRLQYLQQLRIRYRQHKSWWILYLRLPCLIFCLREDEHSEHVSMLAETFVAIQHQAAREAIVCSHNPSQSPS